MNFTILSWGPPPTLETTDFDLIVHSKMTLGVNGCVNGPLSPCDGPLIQGVTLPPETD